MRKYFLFACILLCEVFYSLTMRAQSSPWVSAYYAGWSQGWFNNGVLPAKQIEYEAVTHIIHFGLVPLSDGTVNSDANSIHKSNSDSLIAAAHASGKKVLVCVGGWGTDREFRNATNILTRSLFINNLIGFMRERGYDGIDIDWEVLELSDLAQYTAFIIELRTRLDLISPRPLLTAVTSWQAPIFSLIHDKLDQINLMTYDLSGAWPGWVSWHNAPLYDGGYRFASNGRLIPSADNMIDEFALAGIPKNKLGIGIDFYGYVWSGGSGTPTGGVTEPRQTWSSPPQIRANVPYYSLMQEQYQPKFYRWDSIAQASYMSVDYPGSANDKFITYDNEMTAKLKMEYVKTKGIGGVIIWELGGGMLPGPYSNRNRLMKTIKKSLQNISENIAPPASIITPLNFTRGVSPRPKFQWQSSTDASWYRIQIAYDSLFSHPVIDQRWIVEPSFHTEYFMPDTVYYWRIQSSDPFVTSPWSPVFVFGTAVDSLIPSWWQYISNTGDNATIVLPSTLIPTIGKRTLQPGDLIGVFYRQSDTLICAGYSQWEQGKNNVITIWGDNVVTPVKDGFQNSDTIYFKFWERKFGSEATSIPVYSSGGYTYTTDGIYVLQQLAAPADDKQILTTTSGWNMISSFIRPNDPAVPMICSPIAGNLVLLKNSQGKTFMPDSNINTIGVWNATEGYLAYMRTPDTFAITGELLVPESTAINLSAGWNMIGYLRTTPSSPESALTSITQHLLLVKDNEGKIFWPEYGIKTLNAMQPGQGFKINVKQSAVLFYPPNTHSKMITSPPARIQSEPAVVDGEPMEYYPRLTRTGNNAIMLIQSSQLNEGDEIGVWSERDALIGTGKVIRGQCALILWGKDPFLHEHGGAEEGERLRMTLWKKKLQREFQLSITSLKDAITQNAVTLPVQYSSESVLIGTAKTIPFTHYLDQNFPNPFNPATTITYGVSEREHVQIEVFNSVGQRITILVAGMHEPGEYSVTFRTSSARKFRLASGVYYYRMQAGNVTVTKKMLMLK